MTKPFSINIRRPRSRNLLLARALLFAISIVLVSSSAENVEPYDDTTERNLLAPQRVGQSSGGGAVLIIEPLLERELHSKSAKAAKSSKIGSKSGSSKGSKTKAAKSKSGKSKAAKSKAAKNASAESKESKAAKSKAAKSVSAESKAAKSVSAKSKAEKGKSAKSLDSFQTNYLDDMELDTETETIPPVPEEKEESVAITQSSSSAESTSVYHDSLSSNGDSSTEEMEDIGSTRSDATATSSDGVEHDDGDVMSIESGDVLEPTNLRGDSMDENNNGNLDFEEDTQSLSNNISPTDNNSSEEEIEGTSDARPSSDTGEYGNESEDNVDTTNLKAEFLEERIEESEAVEILDEKEAILDPSWETLG
eukprot:CAMPEP_0201913914 /NCGR_PEP_ID=MMETSP0903-20130614/4240_1 /ASSEMBLY_ACC=CAM_ASM_000552 /TAXON_ID=420261 /ORGANISM="Thalassiosira antarctica, Strain CCMP982" /LENGTH=364 /DNA_ID=CAMNT_0048449203 /DNA_START=213 /DNA_END=1307 /DNA_ORIENTATION=+